MANYLKRINLGILTAPQVSDVVTFLEALGLTSTQASNTKQFTLSVNIAGQVGASAVVEVDGATDSAVLDDVNAGVMVQLLVR